MKITFLKNSFKLILALIITFYSSGFLLSQSLETDSLLKGFDKMKSSEKIDTLSNLSKYFYSSNPDKAIEYGMLAVEFAEKKKDINKKAYNLRNIGLAFFIKGERKKALEYFKNSYELYETLENKKKILLLKSNIGMVYYKLGEYDKSIGVLLEAEKIFDELPTDDLDTNTLINAADNFTKTGQTYLRIKNYSKSLYYHNKAMEIYDMLNYYNEIALTYNNIGNVYFRRNIFDTAKINYQKALTIYESENNVTGLAHTFGSIGNIYWIDENYDSAAYWIKKSLSNYKKAKNITGIAAMLNNLGGLYVHLKEYEKSKQMLDESLELARAINSKIRVQQTFLALSDLYEATGEYKKSRNYLLRYSEIKDTIYNENSSRQIAEMQTKYETEKKEKEIQIQSLKLENRDRLFIFIGVFILFITLLVILLFNRYKLKQRNFQNELEKSNLEIEQKLLRSQMNPHFIFNSLNSIKSFIIENEPDSAEIYLGKFAKLMRYILDNSRESFIPVEDEINTLQLYMELERVRFSNKFDFKINIEPEIDVERTYISPMFIQPFVENSILHGVTKKTNKGNINLNLIKEGNIIKCLIVDDGVGRERSQKLKNQQTRKSLGMQLIKERLGLINKQIAETISVDIIDLKDENGNASGTKVELNIPFEIE
jgi:tetratricopeptide (TPR) repeat protein